jgi:hypothetical protein
MKKQMRAFVLIVAMGIAHIGYTQESYKIEETKNVEMKLKGTSTMHDWEMDAQYATGEAQFIFKPGSDSELTSLKSLYFNLYVLDLKSESNGLDKNAYKALKSDKFKDIRYTLKSATISPEKGGYLLKSIGTLSIAGVTKDILMDVHSVINENGTISCRGSYNLNMTDFNVEPPSFMWGAMKTGDALTLDFVVIYKK